jgi:hypothetical protein
MKRQMLFIEPTAVQVHIFSQFTLPRLGTFILAGLVNRRSSWSARVFIEGQQRFDLDAWIAQSGRPEVVNRDWQKRNQAYLRALADASRGSLVQQAGGGN